MLLALLAFTLSATGEAYIGCAALFLIAVSTDALDGWLARRYGWMTQLGRILDPLADKLVILGMLLFLLPHRNSGVSPWMVLIVLLREFLVTGLRNVFEERGIDFSAQWSGKLKMFIQSGAVLFATLMMDDAFRTALGSRGLWLRDMLLWLMCLVTLWSGWHYIHRSLKLNHPD